MRRAITANRCPESHPVNGARCDLVVSDYRHKGRCQGQMVDVAGIPHRRTEWMPAVHQLPTQEAVGSARLEALRKELSP